MRTILNILLFLSLAAGASRCNGGNTGNNEINTNAFMKGYTIEVNESGLDSLFMVDTLPNELGSWIMSYYKDYETGINIIKYTYIKEYTDTSETIYIVMPRDSVYKVTKRVVGVD